MHENFAKLAVKLIAKNGRDVELITYEETGSRFDKTLVPVSTTVTAVQTAFSQDEIDGDLIHVADQKFLIAANGVAPTIDAKIQSDGTLYSIKRVDLVKPGTTKVLYKVQGRLEK